MAPTIVEIEKLDYEVKNCLGIDKDVEIVLDESGNAENLYLRTYISNNNRVGIITTLEKDKSHEVIVRCFYSIIEEQYYGVVDATKMINKLYDIFKAVCDEGFHAGVIEDDLIFKVAIETFTQMDYRHGLHLLKTAGDAANLERTGKIYERHIPFKNPFAE